MTKYLKKKNVGAIECVTASIIIVLMILLIIFNARKHEPPTDYQTYGIVVAKSAEGTLIVKDETDNLWAVENYDLDYNTKLLLDMNNNGNNVVADDTIVNIWVLAEPLLE